jgi:hypothetical protein
VEFYSSSFSKELKREEETGRRHLDGGNEEGGVPDRFGYSREEESSRQWRTTRWRGRRGGGADESRRWEMMPCWAVPGRKTERSGPILVGVKER